jgi:hypothetical protein
MQVTRTATTVKVKIPPSANRMPPGPYMLFLIGTSGVPSVAKMVRVY